MLLPPCRHLGCGSTARGFQRHRAPPRTAVGDTCGGYGGSTVRVTQFLRETAALTAQSPQRHLLILTGRSVTCDRVHPLVSQQRLASSERRTPLFRHCPVPVWQPTAPARVQGRGEEGLTTPRRCLTREARHANGFEVPRQKHVGSESSENRVLCALWSSQSATEAGDCFVDAPLPFARPHRKAVADERYKIAARMGAVQHCSNDGEVCATPPNAGPCDARPRTEPESAARVPPCPWVVGVAAGPTQGKASRRSARAPDNVYATAMALQRACRGASQLRPMGWSRSRPGT